MSKAIGSRVFASYAVHTIRLDRNCMYQQGFDNDGAKPVNVYSWFYVRIKASKKEGKDLESIQSSTTPDPGYQ